MLRLGPGTFGRAQGCRALLTVLFSINISSATRPKGRAVSICSAHRLLGTHVLEEQYFYDDPILYSFTHPTLTGLQLSASSVVGPGPQCRGQRGRGVRRQRTCRKQPSEPEKAASRKEKATEKLCHSVCFSADPSVRPEEKVLWRSRFPGWRRDRQGGSWACIRKDKDSLSV